jgi:hypothetical protein
MVSVVDRPQSLIRVFQTGAATFLSSSSSFIHEAEWTPFENNCYSENLVAPGIVPGTSGLAARNSLLDHRGGEGDQIQFQYNFCSFVVFILYSVTEMVYQMIC